MISRHRIMFKMIVSKFFLANLLINWPLQTKIGPKSRNYIMSLLQNTSLVEQNGKVYVI